MQFGISSIHSATKQLRGALTLVGGSLHGNAGTTRGHDSDQKPLIKSPFDPKGFAGLQDDSDSDSDFSFAYEANETTDEIKSSTLNSSTDLAKSSNKQKSSKVTSPSGSPRVVAEKRQPKAAKVDAQTETNALGPVERLENNATGLVELQEQGPIPTHSRKVGSGGHPRIRSARRTKSNPDSLVGISKYLGEKELTDLEGGKVDAMRLRNHEKTLKVRHTPSRDSRVHAVDRTRPRAPRRTKSDPETLIGISQSQDAPPVNKGRDTILHDERAPIGAIHDAELDIVDRALRSESKNDVRDCRVRSRVAPRRQRSDPNALVGMLIQTQDVDSKDLDEVDLEELENLEKMLELNSPPQPSQYQEHNSATRPRPPRRRKSDPLSLVGIAQQYLEKDSAKNKVGCINGTKSFKADSRKALDCSIHSSGQLDCNQNGRQNKLASTRTKSDPDSLICLSKHFENSRLKESNAAAVSSARVDGQEIPVRWVQTEGHKHLELHLELSKADESRKSSRQRRNSGSKTVA